MERMHCAVKYNIYEPLVEYRSGCPWIFVMYSGEHTHPVPFQLKTPSRLRNDVFDLLHSMHEDLVDLTPRGLLRHASVRRYVSSKLPDNSNATLADVHVSLANRAHLGMYIRQAKAQLYPHGSGWQGMFFLPRSGLGLTRL